MVLIPNTFKLSRNMLAGNYEKPKIFLCHADKERITQLDTTNTKISLKFNSFSELTFDIGRTYNDITSGKILVNPFYDKIEALRLIELDGLGYFEIQGPQLNSDGIKESKSITAYSLEYTLSQRYLENFYVNTGELDSIEVIYSEANGTKLRPIILYNPSNPSLSLLHLILEKIYGWKIGHIDSSLQTLSRSFEVDRESVYDFIMNEICDKFNCYAVFDTYNNTINLYAESLTARFVGDGQTNKFIISPPFYEIGTVSVGGYKTTRWSYEKTTGALILEDVPESGEYIEVIDGSLEKWETDVFVSFENLSQEVNIDYDADSIKTCLTVKYGDDGDIREVNLGMPYIIDLSYYYNVDWMGQDLYDAYTRYLQKCNSYQSQYSDNSQEMLNIAGCIDHEENRLSLEYSIAQSVNSTTVGTYYIRVGTDPYYYKEVSLPEEYNVNIEYYSIDTANLNEDKVLDLYNVLKKYFNSEETWESELDKIASNFQFMKVYTLSMLKNDLKKATTITAKDKAVNSFLDKMWEEIGRTPLKLLYYDTYKTIQTTNVEAGWAEKSSDNYWYYYPVVLYLKSIENAINQRDLKIKEYEISYKSLQNENITIGNQLLVNNNFTEKQLIRLNSFLREDELIIEDVVETDLDSTADIFKNKQDAMESGRIELQKICQPRLQFSMTMANIYALPEFEPIIDQFQLGRVIKVKLRPDYIKQSRLLQIDISLDDFSDFSCEFGELTDLRTESDIHADLLSQAISAGKSVATNASYWTKGTAQVGSIQQKIDAGLLDAVTSLKSMDATQGVEIDKYGIHLKSINPDTGIVDPKQGWITNNKFLYSDDGFESAKAVFGEYKYDGNNYYGILAEALVGKLIIGTQIEIGNSVGSLKFNEDGLSITNDINSFVVNPNDTNLLSISNKNGKIFYLDDSGVLHIKGDGAGLDITTNKSITSLDGRITNTIADFKVATDKISSSVSQVQTDVVGLSSKVVYYGSCSTTSSTIIKVVENCDGFKLENGSTVIVSFTYANTANGPKLNVNGTGAKIIRAYGNNLTSNSSYNWADNSTVTFIYDANGSCWRIADSSAFSRIIQTADNILLETNKTLNETLSDYSTTTEMNAAINISAEGITNKVTAVETNLSKNYSTTSQMNSSIEQKAKSIISSVSTTYTTKNEFGETKEELSSRIEQNEKSITSKVSYNEFGTQITQNSTSIQYAWNQCSNYIQFENGEINIYKSTTHNSSTLLMKQNYEGAYYYHNGNIVGKIGTGSIDGYDTSRGIIFDISDGKKSFMAWVDSDKTKYNYNDFKLVYSPGNVDGLVGPGFTFNSPVIFNDSIDLNSLVWTKYGVVIGNDASVTIQPFTDSESYKGIELYNIHKAGVRTRVWQGSGENYSAFGVYRDKYTFSASTSKTIDVGKNNITNESDARLKTNIGNTKVDALNTLSSIELKEFDWIEDGDHEDIGMIAQQLKEVIPELVYEDPSTGKLSIKTIKIIPYLIKAIQELYEKYESKNGKNMTGMVTKWVDTFDSSYKKDFINAIKVRYNDKIDELKGEDKYE